MRRLQVHGHSQQKVGKKRATRCIKGPHVVTELKEESVRTWLLSCLYLSFEKQYRGNKGKF